MVIFADPGRTEWYERGAEQQTHVGPHDTAVDAFGRFEQMMMVVPIDGDIDEAQQISKKFRHERHEVGEVGAFGRMEFDDHDGNDNGEDAVAECFEPSAFK